MLYIENLLREQIIGFPTAYTYLCAHTYQRAHMLTHTVVTMEGGGNVKLLDSSQNFSMDVHAKTSSRMLLTYTINTCTYMSILTISLCLL